MITNILVRAAALLAILSVSVAHGADEPLCGDEGVWLQILGAGGPELDDGQRGSSYLIWHNNKARMLIDTGPGSSAAFDLAGAQLEDLYAIAFTHLHANNATDFPAYVNGSSLAERTEPLVVLGPDSNNERFPDTETFVERLIGPQGAFPYLQDYLTVQSSGGYPVRARNVPATGKRRWARFGNAELRLAAIPVNHGDVPALAWRVEIGDRSIVINVIPEFAKNADALVVTHAIPENARGRHREQFALPSQLGRIAKQADARLLVLSQRMNRTRGRESQSRAKIEESYDGYIIFANDMECWGL